MNIIEIQESLKDFSQEQLVNEVRNPTGNAPQYLVLSELNRRRRMREDHAAREARDAPTVAQKLVAAAGVPQSGVSGMAQQMAPRTDMLMNTGIGAAPVKAMAEGGLAGEEEDDGFLGKAAHYGGKVFDYAKENPLDAFLWATMAVPGVGVAGNIGLRGGLWALRAANAARKGRLLSKGASGLGRLAQRGVSVPKMTKAGKPYKSGARVFSPMRTMYTVGGLGTGANLGKAFFGSGEAVADEPHVPEFEPVQEEAVPQDDGRSVYEEAGQAGPPSTVDRIIEAYEGRKRAAEQDKWLAMAQAGFAMMEPNPGGFGGALGKAGAVGTEALTGARERYQRGVADLLETEMSLARMGESSTEKIKTYTDYLSALMKEEELTGEDTSEERKNLQNIISDLIAGGVGAVDLGELGAAR